MLYPEDILEAFQDSERMYRYTDLSERFAHHEANVLSCLQAMCGDKWFLNSLPIIVYTFEFVPTNNAVLIEISASDH